MRPLLYVCAPWASRTPAEWEETKKAITSALALGWAPIFTPPMYDYRGDDSDLALREHGLQASESIIGHCGNVLVIGSRRTLGMERELDRWGKERLGTWSKLHKWPDLGPPVRHG